MSLLTCAQAWYVDLCHEVWMAKQGITWRTYQAISQDGRPYMFCHMTNENKLQNRWISSLNHLETAHKQQLRSDKHLWLTPSWKARQYVTKQAVWEAPQYASAPCKLTFDLFDLESGVRVTCDVDYFCANFSLPRPLCSRLRPDVRDRQTSDVRRASSLNASTLSGRRHNNI